MKNSGLHAIALLAFLLQAGCGFVHDETLVARYRIVAVDTNEDRALCWGLDSGDCVGDGLGGATLFAAGFDDAYVVEAVRDASGAAFYYIVRDKPTEGSDLGPPGSLVGPFTKQQFEARKAKLRLPDFSRYF